MSWDDNLKGKAKEIAEIDHSPLRIIAGPGTGKTFVLIRRVGRLVHEGVDPDKILVCTFTRTAARDLLRELQSLNISGVDNVTSGTIHGLCFSILSREDVLRVTGRVPRPLIGKDYEIRFLIEDLGSAWGNVNEREKKLRAFEADWARLQSDEPGWPSDPQDRRFHHEVLGWLKFHEAMLIGELVPETLHYLRNNPASEFRTKFTHINVDEYQDLNRAEQVLLDILAENSFLTIVGDEDQSIYSFKYAHPDGILEFGETHENTHDERLDDCIRCPDKIIKMANSLISNNRRRNQERILHYLPGNPQGEVHIVQWNSLDEETEGIANFIRSKIASGVVNPGNVLVLSPRRHFGYTIRNHLNGIGIPAHSFFHEEALEGNPKDKDNSKAQQALTLLTLLANPEDRVALRCWCGFGSPSLRSNAWARLREYCEQNRISPQEALEQLGQGEINITNSSGLLDRFRLLREKLSELQDLSGAKLLDALFPINEPWAEPFRSLASGLNNNDYSAKELRDCLITGITQPELPTDVDYVRIMSLHKSKGLTAELVVVVGCMEGLIPGTYDREKTILTESEWEEEQRRLFYVAITRTKNILVLSSVRNIPWELAHRLSIKVSSGNRILARTLASKFLSQLGPECPRPISGNDFLRLIQGS